MPHEVLGFREIVRHCTTWPDWTYFTSTVQHQNIDQSSSMRLGNVDYTVGCASASQEDFADLSVFSQPTTDGPNDTYEIMLSFLEGAPITRDFADGALDMVCEAARLFSADPDMALPSAAELRNKHPQVPFDDVPPATPNDDAWRMSLLLQNISRDHELNLSTLVCKAWQQVLELTDAQTGVEEAPVDLQSAGDDLGPETSFFSLGGDIIGLAQLALVFEQEGFRCPRLEDLVDYPTVRGHMAVLASQSRLHSGGGGAQVRKIPPVTAASCTVDLPLKKLQDGPRSPLARALRLAKRYTRRKNGPRCEASAPAAA
jgi:hypothetical protein